MKRYRVKYNDHYSSIEDNQYGTTKLSNNIRFYEDDNGPWVKFEDVIKAVHNLISAFPHVLNRATIRELLDIQKLKEE